MTTVTISGKTVTNKHTDALESVLRVNVTMKTVECRNKYGWKELFCVGGHEFKTRRELANHLLEMVNKIPCDISKLKNVKSNSFQAFEFN